MNAALFYGPGDVRFERIEVPKPGPGEVLLKVGAALTCGTDIKTYQRGHPTMIKKIPCTFGHEFSGTIVELGERVNRFQPGMRVVPANTAPCQRCFYCKNGRQSLCEDLLYMNGGYAEYIAIPERIVRFNLLEIPDHLSFQEAALTEPLAGSAWPPDFSRTQRLRSVR
jgi:L-iditol 2-dehydrogenase